MVVVRAKEAFPDAWTSSIFLAGPSPRGDGAPSWRPEVIRALEAAGYDGVVFNPEVGDILGSGADAYLDQVEWERKGLDMCDVILFWIPRDMNTMPGLTTNVEFGLYVSSGKIVLGAPEGATGIKYLEHALRDVVGEDGVRHTTIENTVRACRAKLTPEVFRGNTIPRVGGARCVPLHIWEAESFQSWYRSQIDCGNKLDDAKLLWHFMMPRTKIVFSWVLWVRLWVGAENRHKNTEWVFSRADSFSTVLYRAGPDILDAEVVLIREFRSTARTPDAMIHDLPGGASTKPGKNPVQVASAEVHEETGLIIPAHRFRPMGSRQAAGTLSAHHTHLFSAEITEAEMAQAKILAQNQVVHGVAEDSERTIIEVTTFRDMLRQGFVDWSTLGMVAQVILSG